MTRVLPRPGLSLLILGVWLILAPAPTLGQVLIGVMLAVALPLATRGFWPGEIRLRRPLVALRLLGVVLGDIVTANLLVARQVLGAPERLRPAFMDVPLGIADPFVSTLLGSIVSLTPGTVSVDIDRGRQVLQVHALHIEDPAATIALIKARYETPLKEIFGC
ncbi:Na+/H+ antiporter subunit E [Falsiroseomonas oryziterrae]|uniref:Na+/H+ antiporter subunit E n=1 Tax=Falsiroseomonas oryziterrae TaxID=2911368 RepID=UPI001F015CB9|nr:Na+/H+ antiporter subunit E [Roseomonas sp. NPKOSM-4]